MALKAILVHLDHTARCELRLDLAVALAVQHQAQLNGYYSSGKPEYNLPAAGEGFTADSMQALFRQKTAQAGLAADWIDSSEADQLTLPLVDRLILHAFYADLVIVGQLDPGSGSRGFPADFPEQVALSAARPVLVIPRRGDFHSLGERVMIAWRGGRASSRALHDAIPLLQQARHVSLVLVNPLYSNETETRNLCNYLIRNDIPATCRRVVAEGLSAGDVLLNQACDLGSDLLVVGILPRTRRGKISLGPVGRYLLDFMTIPLLISG
jgi:nucleotide-binding universal stress UspA family protein